MNKYEYVKKAIHKRLVWFNGLKDSKPCTRCQGIFPPYVMDWHHRDRLQKLFNISQGKTRFSRKKIIDEISKCDLLCANCHRIVEYGISVAE